MNNDECNSYDSFLDGCAHLDRVQILSEIEISEMVFHNILFATGSIHVVCDC